MWYSSCKSRRCPLTATIDRAACNGTSRKNGWSATRYPGPSMSRVSRNFAGSSMPSRNARVSCTRSFSGAPDCRRMYARRSGSRYTVSSPGPPMTKLVAERAEPFLGEEVERAVVFHRLRVSEVQQRQRRGAEGDDGGIVARPGTDVDVNRFEECLPLVTLVLHVLDRPVPVVPGCHGRIHAALAVHPPPHRKIVGVVLQFEFPIWVRQDDGVSRSVPPGCKAPRFPETGWQSPPPSSGWCGTADWPTPETSTCPPNEK